MLMGIIPPPVRSVSMGPLGITPAPMISAVAAVFPTKEPRAFMAWREAPLSLCWARPETAEWKTRSIAVPVALQSAMVRLDTVGWGWWLAGNKTHDLSSYKPL